MILKGNIRANGAELARHLMNDRHEIDPADSFQPVSRGNERVEVAEVRGFAANDLAGAFAEAEAIAAGTRCTKPLYSLSINPSQPMSREQYAQAVDRIEDKLGLTDQARAVVFHTKNGREHCHVVWSRIDHEKMQARHMEFDRQKLREVARELVREFGHEMPRHLGADRGNDRFKDDFKQVSLAEQGQASRSGLEPADRKETITAAYQRSDNAETFRAALGEHDFILAQGDKRGFVVVDRAGEVHSLNRQIDAKAKEIREKLQIDGIAEDLPTVQQAKEQLAEKMREKAAEKAKEGEHAPSLEEQTAEHLKTLTDAEKAELKAVKGHYAESLAHIRDTTAERIDDAKAAIKEAYRPEWRDLFKRQREELDAVKEQTASPARRLKALLSGRAGDAFDFENRGTLAGAFNFLIRGEITTEKLTKVHKAEKAALGDMQKLAEREEIRAIKQEAKEQRQDAREDHTAALTATRESYAEQREEAARLLEESRKEIERQGRDVTQGEKAERENVRAVFGFSSQGFGKAGLSFGRGQDKEREEDERQLKPPGQSFTP